MNFLEQTLSHFGLTKNETAVYLEAIKLEETSPFALARLTGIPRTTIYDILMTLSLKGLVTLTQSDGFTKQQTRIRANNPSTLRTLIHQKQHDLASLEVDIVDILPQLKKDFQKASPHADFRFYPGIEGAKEVMATDYFPDVSLPVAIFENLMPMDSFGHQVMNQNITATTTRDLSVSTQVRELIPLTAWTKHVLTYQYGRNHNYLIARNIRYVENPIFNLHQRLVIQGNRLAITTAEADEAWGLVMNSVSLAQSLRSLFETIWLTAQPVTGELLDSFGPNVFLQAEKASLPLHRR